VTVHGIVIALLLLFPWGLVGVTFLATVLEHVRRAWRFRSGEPSVPSQLERQRLLMQEMHMNAPSADDPRSLKSRDACGRPHDKHVIPQSGRRVTFSSERCVQN